MTVQSPPRESRPAFVLVHSGPYSASSLSPHPLSEVVTSSPVIALRCSRRSPGPSSSCSPVNGAAVVEHLPHWSDPERASPSVEQPHSRVCEACVKGRSLSPIDINTSRTHIMSSWLDGLGRPPGSPPSGAHFWGQLTSPEPIASTNFLTGPLEEPPRYEIVRARGGETHHPRSIPFRRLGVADSSTALERPARKYSSRRTVIVPVTRRFRPYSQAATATRICTRHLRRRKSRGSESSQRRTTFSSWLDRLPTAVAVISRGVKPALVTAPPICST